jgi:hypothetical protein
MNQREREKREAAFDDRLRYFFLYSTEPTEIEIFI